MEKKTGIRQRILLAVVAFACVSAVLGSFVYGRMIGTYYRSTIEGTVDSFSEDISGWLSAAESYLTDVLNLAQNPK